MSFGVVNSRGSLGLDAPLVTVEAHLSPGVPRLSVVGLPETTVKESKDRVRSALMNARFDFPSCRITVSLGPADLPKEGGRFDLPIALSILIASGQLPQAPFLQLELGGELALSGELRPIRGALPFAIAARDANHTLILPEGNSEEARLPQNLILLPARHLLDICQHILNQQTLSPCPERINTLNEIKYALDLSDVQGQTHARRALEIAAAGQHSLLMTGSPGTGKTMLSSRLPSILPLMTEQEALQAAAVLSIAGKNFHSKDWQTRPFRSPHHTASSVALVGGGNPPRPGEISLAHQGVLFLDELPEFNKNVLEALREPLESGHITISRASHQTQFPAEFQLICAMNPCPCGYAHESSGRCQCTPDQIKRYQNRLSGPLLDRIDMHIVVPPLPKGTLSHTSKTPEASKIVQRRVIQARALQLQRCGKSNRALTNKEIELFCSISYQDHQMLDIAMDKFNLSARAYHRILKIARTIADLSGHSNIQTEDLSEAISYRKMSH